MTESSLANRNNFARRMTDILNGGALNIGLAVGYRAGLFETMHRLGRFASDAEIASAAGLDRRYIREWLGIMATGRIVDISEENGQDVYSLPPDHAAFLIREGEEGNLGVYTQEIPLLTLLAMERVEGGLRSGDGVSYEIYPRFHQFMAELSEAKHRKTLIQDFLPSVAEGQMVQRLQQGIRVCDLGCGEGVATLLMAEAFPASKFVGLDISGDVISKGLGAARDKGLANADFWMRDSADLEQDDSLADSFDYIIAFDAIHDQTRPLEALRGILRMLSPGGCFSMVDIDAQTRHIDNMDHSMGPFLYAVSLLHCLPVGRANGGAGLGMMWGRKQALELLGKAGFENVQALDMPFDPFNVHYYCKK